jgi:hypothetical protein
VGDRGAVRWGGGPQTTQQMGGGGGMSEGNESAITHRAEAIKRQAIGNRYN